MTDDFLVPDASPLEQAIYRHHREQTHETKQDMLELMVDDTEGFVPVMFLCSTDAQQIIGYPSIHGNGTDRFDLILFGEVSTRGEVYGETLDREGFGATLSELVGGAFSSEDINFFIWPTHAVAEQIMCFCGLQGKFKARRWFDRFGVVDKIRDEIKHSTDGHLSEEPGLYKDYLEVLRLNLAIASKLARKRREG